MNIVLVCKDGNKVVLVMNADTMLTYEGNFLTS
jgi:hypothetical protein